MIRILVVDDHPVVREGLVAVLGYQRDFEVIGAVGSAQEAIILTQSQHPHIVLLDLELPGMNGVEAIPHLSRVSPETRVIILTAYETEECVLNAIQSGARGYLLKGATSNEISQAIRVVYNGESYLTPRITTLVLGQDGRSRHSLQMLTNREQEVLRLVAEGLPNKQIAQKLSIAEPTVKFHLTSLFNKLGADNRAQAVSLAAKRGLL